MALNEIQRQAYLEAMGVQSYFPRYVLPGALPSRQCQWPAPVKSRRAAPAPAAPASSTPADLKAELDSPPPRSQTARAPRERAAGPTHTAPPATPVAGALTADNTGEAIRFRLVILQAGELCVLCELPEHGPDQLTPAQHRLLFNLLASLGVGPEQARLDERPFRWPFAESEYLDKSIGAARAALRAHLQQRRTRQSFHTVLLLGRRVAPCLSVEAAIPPRPGDLPGNGEDWQVQVTDSLQTLLEEPGRKREAWRRLRATRVSVGENGNG